MTPRAPQGAGTLTSASAAAALSSPCSHPKAPLAPSLLEHVQSSQLRRSFLAVLLLQISAWLTAYLPLGLCSNFTSSMKPTLNNQCNPETSPWALVPLNPPHLIFFFHSQYYYVHYVLFISCHLVYANLPTHSPITFSCYHSS